MKYRKGDVVKFREDLVVERDYGCYCVTGPMLKALSEQSFTHEIVGVVLGGYYIAGYSRSWFTDEMIEGLVKEGNPSVTLADLLAVDRIVARTVCDSDKRKRAEDVMTTLIENMMKG